MSTPIPPNSKLEGLELYAPRRPRVGAALRSQDSLSQARPHGASNNELQSQEDDQSWSDAESTATAQERLDDAIRQVIDLGRPARDPELASATLPPAANLELPQAKGPPAKSGSPRLDRRLPQTGKQRCSRLHPQVLAEPPIDRPRRAAPLLARFALVVGFAAAAAYGLTMISPPQPDAGRARTSDRISAVGPIEPDEATEPKSPARLIVENQQAFANEPVSLGVSVDRATGHELLLLAGLTAGTRLSAGAPLGESGWQLPSSDLRNVFMYAPKDFVGVMNTAVNLLSSNEKLMDARAVQFAWVAKKSDPASPFERFESKVPNGIPVQPIDHEQDALLMKQGEDLLSTGDIAGARRAFQHLADAGNAQAALALGVTFDPRYLVEHNVIGIVGDKAKARTWYQRAMELGSTEAKNILSQMTEK